MTKVAPPLGLLAELSHRCPLQCVYCSNPLELVDRAAELGTDEWLRVFDQAAALGVVQLHLSGGEPLIRADLERFVRHARGLGMFTNLITSGVGLTAERAATLAAAGLNSVQLSVQGVDAAATVRVAKAPVFERKRRAAELIRQAGLPLSMNVVLHRLNLDRVGELIDLAAEWGADRLELANTQYYGWALRNRHQLLPTAAQVAAAEAVYRQKQAELAGRVELIWVVPDYHERFPKPCMGGWAATALTVAPDGVAYPCPVASVIETLDFPSVRTHSLEWIWYSAPAFTAYRGTSWMPDPCRSCDRRDLDFGGCRCQAYALTGDAGRTDPVCERSPDHGLVTAAVAGLTTRGATERSADDLIYRRYAEVSS